VFDGNKSAGATGALLVSSGLAEDTGVDGVELPMGSRGAPVPLRAATEQPDHRWGRSRPANPSLVANERVVL